MNVTLDSHLNQTTAHQILQFCKSNITATNELKLQKKFLFCFFFSSLSLSILQSDLGENVFGDNNLGHPLLGRLASSVIPLFHTAKCQSPNCLEMVFLMLYSDICFSKTDFYFVLTHPNCIDQKTAKISAFIKICTPADDHFISS